MFKIIIFISLVFSIFSCSTQTQSIKRNPSSEKNADGHVVANGGDAVLCNKSSSNSFEGIYVLDDLLSTSSKIDVSSSYEYLDKLTAKLKSLGTIGDDFFDFYFSFSTRNISHNYKSKIKWTINDGELINIKDENLIEKDYRTLTENCSNIFQAVIRKKSNNNEIEYIYSKKVVEELFVKNKIDWLLVHEFLWKYLKNSNEIREVNEFFHSDSFFKMENNEIITVLKEKFNMSIKPQNSNTINQMLKKPLICKSSKPSSQPYIVVYQPIYNGNINGNSKYTYPEKDFSWRGIITLYRYPIYEWNKHKDKNLNIDLTEALLTSNPTEVISNNYMMFTPKIIGDHYSWATLVQNKNNTTYSLEISENDEAALVTHLRDEENNRTLFDENKLICKIKSY